MQCTTCGNELQQDAKFCDACGQLLTSANSANPPPPARPSVARTPTPPKPQVESRSPRAVAQQGRPDKIRGVVRNFQYRTESLPYGQSSRTWTIWTFRLERYNQDSNLVQRVPVEM